MANRFVDVLYRLKDLFTGPAGKISASYRELGKEADAAGKRTERSFAGAGRAMDAAAGTVRRLAAAFGLTVGIGATAASFRRFVDQADRLSKLSRSLGETTERLSVLAEAGELSGISASQLEQGLRKLQIATAETAQGTGRAAKAFEQLGLDAASINNLPIEEKLAALASSLEAIGNPADRISIARRLFGDEAGQEFLRIIDQGAAGFERLMQAARETAVVIDSETGAAAEAFNDSLTALTNSMQRLKVKAFSPVVRELDEFLGNISQSADPIRNLNSEIFRLQLRLENLQNLPVQIRSNVGISRVQTQLLRARRELQELQDQQQATAKAQEERAEASRQEAEAAARITEITKAQSAAYEQARGNLQAQLSAETAELRRAKTEQAQILREFSGLLDDLTRPQRDLTSLDASLLQRQAAAALDRGEIDTAIDKAQQAKQVLIDLKAQGEEGIELGFIARELERVVQAATQRRVDQELIDVQGATTQIRAIEAELDRLKNTEIPVRIRPIYPDGAASLSDAITNEVARRGGK